LGQRIRGLKNPWAKQEDVFLVHPQNSLNDLILNSCIGGYCFTPALTSVYRTSARQYNMEKMNAYLLQHR
jgi:hypothetical protein